jgi:hypothetical protein
MRKIFYIILVFFSLIFIFSGCNNKTMIREDKVINSAVKVSDNEFVIAGYST